MERCIDDELPFEIPESWAWVRWGAIAESIQYGYNAPAKQEGRIRMVRISDIHENTVAWSSVPFCDIDDSDISLFWGCGHANLGCRGEILQDLPPIAFLLG